MDNKLTDKQIQALHDAGLHEDMIAFIKDETEKQGLNSMGLMSAEKPGKILMYAFNWGESGCPLEMLGLCEYLVGNIPAEDLPNFHIPYLKDSK